MIKKLLTILTVTTIVTVSAQTGRIANPTKISQDLSSQSFNFKASATPTTVLISPFSGTSTSIGLNSASSDTSVPGCSPNAGFVYGSNCYDDQEKAQYFSSASYSGAVSQASLVGAVGYFFRSGNEGCSTSSPSVTTALKFYSATSNTVMPGTLIASKTESVTSILAAQTGTPSFFTYTFTLTTPIAISGAFYAAVVTPTTAGDTIVMAAQTGTLASVNNTWEKWSDNSWNNMQPVWGATFKGNMAIFPIISGNTATVTGITKNSAIAKNISIMPNPSNGLVNVNVNFGGTENLNLTVANALGQVVLANKYYGISSEVIALDLTNQTNGIYFITISNGIDKLVQRLIINK